MTEMDPQSVFQDCRLDFGGFRSHVAAVECGYNLYIGFSFGSILMNAAIQSSTSVFAMLAV